MPGPGGAVGQFASMVARALVLPCVNDPDDANTVQSDVAISGDSSEMDIAREAPAFTATTFDLTNRFSELTTAGKCFRDKLALSLLGNARTGLKFVTFLTDADK